MRHWLAGRGDHRERDRNSVQSKVQGVTLYSSPTETVGGTSPLFHTLGYAFNSHCPMVLTPDSVWLTILTGLTHHIDTDPEGLRTHFVNFEGRQTLTYLAGGDRFSKDYPNIVIPYFAEQLQDFIGKKADLIVNNFSTTTPEDRVSSQVALMGAMKHWFDYKMMFCCNLTRITVEGTPEDWGNIIDRAGALTEFGLGWWTDHLIPILDEIRKSAEGTPSIEFWKNAYLKHRKGSGSQYDVSGWINALYPYVAGTKGKMRQNPYVDWQKDHGGRYPGLDSDDFPLGIVKAPVEINDNGHVVRAEFVGGLVGVSMADDFTVKPVSGIALQELEEA